MGIEKDTTFKFIGKNFLEVFFDLANVPDAVVVSNVDEMTEDMISLEIAQFRSDFVGCDGKMVLMLEYESSFVGTPSKKRFHAYVALYDYQNNDDDLDIFFCVLTTKEKSKVVEYRIGDVDSFKISIFNIGDLGFEKIISNSNWKIKNQEEFTIRELVELALTSLMSGNREGIIQQFYNLSKMMDNIKFPNEDSKVSFYGIILLLSNMYFDRDDPLRKKIQGVFMGKVDCIVEMRKEQFDKGYGKGVLDVAKNMLDSGVSIDFIISKTGLSIEDIEKLKLGK